MTSPPSYVEPAETSAVGESSGLSNEAFIINHFAGEDLTEHEEQENLDEDLTPLVPRSEEAASGQRQPLLRRATSSRRRSRSSSVGARGDATVMQAAFMLFKSFIGTGVLFLGKAFYNGGILFSSITMIVIAMISLYSYTLLVQTKFVVTGSFGDIGGALYGPWLRYAILSSITISQIGFVAAYIVFASENLQIKALVMAISDCSQLIDVSYFILLQVALFVPFVLVRNLTGLSNLALLADAFIMVGLAYIFWSEINIIAVKGVANVILFNRKDFPLFIGTAIFSFEGICLLIPITDTMREPHKLPRVLSGVMISLLCLFGVAGVLSYLAFGSDIQPIVLLNLDPTSFALQGVQLLYIFAILLSAPITLFPAIRIMENGIFSVTQSGKASKRFKWLKNAFRTLVVIICGGISWVGAQDLDKFVAFVGCFACVPLCYIYPAMLHLKACANTLRHKFMDTFLIVLGCLILIYTTEQTIWLTLQTGGERRSPFNYCEKGRDLVGF